LAISVQLDLRVQTSPELFSNNIFFFFYFFTLFYIGKLYSAKLKFERSTQYLLFKIYVYIRAVDCIRTYLSRIHRWLLCVISHELYYYCYSVSLFAYIIIVSDIYMQINLCVLYAKMKNYLNSLHMINNWWLRGPNYNVKSYYKTSNVKAVKTKIQY